MIFLFKWSTFAKKRYFQPKQLWCHLLGIMHVRVRTQHHVFGFDDCCCNAWLIPEIKIKEKAIEILNYIDETFLKKLLEAFPDCYVWMITNKSSFF